MDPMPDLGSISDFVLVFNDSRRVDKDVQLIKNEIFKIMDWNIILNFEFLIFN
jgi:hypothetical protein